MKKAILITTLIVMGASIAPASQDSNPGKVKQVIKDTYNATANATANLARQSGAAIANGSRAVGRAAAGAYNATTSAVRKTGQAFSNTYNSAVDGVSHFHTGETGKVVNRGNVMALPKAQKNLVAPESSPLLVNLGKHLATICKTHTYIKALLAGFGSGVRAITRYDPVTPGRLTRTMRAMKNVAGRNQYIRELNLCYTQFFDAVGAEDAKNIKDAAKSLRAKILDDTNGAGPNMRRVRDHMPETVGILLPVITEPEKMVKNETAVINLCSILCITLGSLVEEYDAGIAGIRAASGGGEQRWLGEDGAEISRADALQQLGTAMEDLREEPPIAQSSQGEPATPPEYSSADADEQFAPKETYGHGERAPTPSAPSESDEIDQQSHSAHVEGDIAATRGQGLDEEPPVAQSSQGEPATPPEYSSADADEQFAPKETYGHGERAPTPSAPSESDEIDQQSQKATAMLSTEHTRKGTVDTVDTGSKTALPENQRRELTKLCVDIDADLFAVDYCITHLANLQALFTVTEQVKPNIRKINQLKLEDSDAIIEKIEIAVQKIIEDINYLITPGDGAAAVQTQQPVSPDTIKAEISNLRDLIQTLDRTGHL